MTKPMLDIGLTPEQMEALVYCIDGRYLKWKNQLVDYDNRTHRLGYAKEVLKFWICGDGDD